VGDGLGLGDMACYECVDGGAAPPAGGVASPLPLLPPSDSIRFYIIKE